MISSLNMRVLSLRQLNAKIRISEKSFSNGRLLYKLSKTRCTKLFSATKTSSCCKPARYVQAPKYHFFVFRNDKSSSDVQVLAMKNAELSATLKESQHRMGAMTAAAEELYGKHITVCRYHWPTSWLAVLKHRFTDFVRYACGLEAKLASLESASQASAMKMQQQLAQMQSRHLQELGSKERWDGPFSPLTFAFDLMCTFSSSSELADLNAAHRQEMLSAERAAHQRLLSLQVIQVYLWICQHRQCYL